MKRTALRQRSKRMARLYVQRRKLVAEMLEDAMCAARLQGCTGRATEVHERLSRARGGSILDRDNCVGLCHMCHREITERPAWAAEHGWSLSRRST